MSYVRFENTLKDLDDCFENWENEGLSRSEERARKKLLMLCRDIVDEYGDELDED